MSTVTVIIVNWNSGELLARCLKYLQCQTLTPQRIIVLDNNSADGSSDGVSGMAGVTVIYSEENLGFARGNNFIINKCNTEFVALLNPDAFPQVDWLKNLVTAAEKNPHIAAFGSMQLMHEKPELLDGIGDVYHMSGLPQRRGYGRQVKATELKPCEIFSPCAAAALYRTDVLKKMGGFDEDFYGYVEDVDLGFRLRLAGHRSMFAHDAVVSHVGSAASGGKNSDFAVYHGHRNLVWAYVKNMPGWLFWACLPWHLLINFAAVFWFILQGQGNVILKAKRDALLGLPGMWRKRNVIQNNRQVPISEIWRVLDKSLWPMRPS